MRKTFILTSLCLLYSLYTYSQFEYFGSPSELKDQLRKAQEDTTKLHLYVRLSNSHVFSHPDTALQYAQQGLRLAQRLNDQKWIAYNSLSLAQSFIVMGNYPIAIEVALKALAIFEERDDALGIIFSNLMLSYAQREAGDSRRALPYAKKAKQFAEASKDTTSLLIAYEHITGEYERLNELDSALFYGKQLLKIHGKFHSAWVGFYRTIAMVYLKKKQYDVALYYYRMNIEPSIKIGVLTDLLDTYTGIAKVYQQMGNMDSSTFYANKVLREYIRTPNLDARFNAATILAENYQQYKNLDMALMYTKLSMVFKDSLLSKENTKAIQNIFFNEQFRKQELYQQQTEYINRIRIYALIIGLVVLLLIAGLLYRNNKQKEGANALLQEQKTKTELALQELKATQSQLIQKEKMASLGELTAGIAHEIQNPLNFVNNFSEVSTELVEELKQEIKTDHRSEALDIANDLTQNLQKITVHGQRADTIVKGMLQHSRASSGEKKPTDINALVDEYLRLSYNGLRAKDKEFNTSLVTDFDRTIKNVEVVPQEIGRMLLNLFNNAFYATQQKKNQLNGQYQPEVRVSTSCHDGRIEIKVRDNGGGIPDIVKDKIFQPFFTTKPTGQGTGLGLSLSYDIITKGHGGEIKVETLKGAFTEFIVQLPI